MLSTSSGWNSGLDKLFVTCLNDKSEKQIGKAIRNHLDLFINTSLHYVSIRSYLVRQPKNKLILNSEQSFNATG